MVGWNPGWRPSILTDDGLLERKYHTYHTISRCLEIGLGASLGSRPIQFETQPNRTTWHLDIDSHFRNRGDFGLTLPGSLQESQGRPQHSHLLVTWPFLSCVTPCVRHGHGMTPSSPLVTGAVLSAAREWRSTPVKMCCLAVWSAAGSIRGYWHLYIHPLDLHLHKFKEDEQYVVVSHCMYASDVNPGATSITQCQGCSFQAPQHLPCSLKMKRWTAAGSSGNRW